MVHDLSSKQHLAKDGISYATYQDKVNANIRYNKKLLTEKGLDKPLSSHVDRPKKPNRITPSKMKSGALSEPRRSSRRGRQPPEYLPLEEEPIIKRKKRTAGTNRSKSSSAVPALTEEERQTLEAKSEWLDEFGDYLLSEENLSQANYASVVRQVNKLASGAGITYSRWSDGVVFGKGLDLTLSSNYDSLFNEAVDFEDQHGRDLGNGWLLRHPIKKLSSFQRFCFEQNHSK